MTGPKADLSSLWNYDQVRYTSLAYLFKNPVHFATHAAFLAIGGDSPVTAEVRFAYRQTSGSVDAHMSVVFLREEVGFEEGIVDEGLEDGREETCLGQVEQWSNT